MSQSAHLRHIEIVFDDHERIALIDQTLHHAKKEADVLEMEAGGGFIENEEAGLATSWRDNLWLVPNWGQAGG